MRAIVDLHVVLLDKFVVRFLFGDGTGITSESYCGGCDSLHKDVCCIKLDRFVYMAMG